MTCDVPKSEAEWRELLADGSIRVPQAVELCGLGRTKVYAAMAAGELAFFKAGASRLIPRRSLTRWLAQVAVRGAY